VNSNNYYITVRVESTLFEQERFFPRQRGVITYLRRVKRLHRTILLHENKTRQNMQLFARKHPLKVSVIPHWKMEGSW